MTKFNQDRKVREGTEDPEQLLAHCDNPKIHPMKQTEAVKASIRELGWMAKIKVNLRTSDEWGSDRGVEVVIDGHDRIKAAMQEGVQEVPVEYYDLSPSEEKLFLLTYDPIGTLFVDDREMTAKLLEEANTGEEALQALLAERAEELGIVEGQSLDDLWEGMPEFENAPKAFRSISIHFEKREYFQEFISITGIEITEKTRSVWYPKAKDNLHMDKSLQWVDDE